MLLSCRYCVIFCFMNACLVCVVCVNPVPHVISCEGSVAKRRVPYVFGLRS